jgi:cation diffusion facilitator CzcD-associated flavoprotein CzcO
MVKGKKVAVIGAGSSAAQVVPSIQPLVEKMHCLIKSPTWITAGFAQKFAGPGGGNFACKWQYHHHMSVGPRTVKC